MKIIELMREMIRSNHAMPAPSKPSPNREPGTLPRPKEKPKHVPSRPLTPPKHVPKTPPKAEGMIDKITDRFKKLQ